MVLCATQAGARGAESGPVRTPLAEADGRGQSAAAAARPSPRTVASRRPTSPPAHRPVTAVARGSSDRWPQGRRGRVCWSRSARAGPPSSPAPQASARRTPPTSTSASATASPLHGSYLPSLTLELVPGMDLAPSWTAAAASAGAGWGSRWRRGSPSCWWRVRRPGRACVRPAGGRHPPRRQRAGAAARPRQLSPQARRGEPRRPGRAHARGHAARHARPRRLRRRRLPLDLLVRAARRPPAPQPAARLRLGRGLRRRDGAGGAAGTREAAGPPGRRRGRSAGCR